LIGKPERIRPILDVDGKVILKEELREIYSEDEKWVKVAQDRV
jgi:hypothetical protein